MGFVIYGGNYMLLIDHPIIILTPTQRSTTNKLRKTRQPATDSRGNRCKCAFTDSEVSRDLCSNVDWFTDTVNSFISSTPRNQVLDLQRLELMRNKKLAYNSGNRRIGQGQTERGKNICQEGFTRGSWWGTFYINNTRSLWVINDKLRGHRVAPSRN